MSQVPRWGRVTAQANEFLVHIREGKVVKAGQGISCFKWPADSVAIVATSVAKLSFKADQVTLEKVGVEVTGLAVYRIAEPLLAYKMIDHERGSLTDILREMFIGATRRIVASLSLEECLTHRKERVAQALMREISPVLAGEGMAEDGTSQGWGVVLDTIEIQDVKVLSNEVFARLQAPFRESLALKALAAREEVAREEARLAAERRRAEEASRRALMAEEEARLAATRRREIEAREHQDALGKRAQEAELARLQERAEAERARARVDLERQREARVLEAELVAMERTARAELTEGQLRELMLTQTIPAVATALRGSFEKIHVTPGEAAQLVTLLGAGLARLRAQSGGTQR